MLGCGSSQVRRRQIVNKWWKPEVMRAAVEVCVCVKGPVSVEGGARNLARGRRQRFHGTGDIRAASPRKSAASNVRVWGREGNSMLGRGKTMWQDRLLGWWPSLTGEEGPWLFPRFGILRVWDLIFEPVDLGLPIILLRKSSLRFDELTYAILMNKLSKAVGK